jgi:molybdenum cofactor biosynthesis enzyme
MIDITHKLNSLRKATASAIVKVSKQETIDAVKNKTVPKVIHLNFQEPPVYW